MDSSAEVDDPELRQSRLAKFGCVIALVTLGFVALNAAVSIWIGSFSFNLASVPLLTAIAAFTTLWLLLRGAPRSLRFVRIVELCTLFVGAAAFASIAVVLDLTASPDMIARTMLTFMLLVYAVYVPSTAWRTLQVALLMTVPLLVCVFLAFSKWDPALHSPRAATWPEQEVGDMAYPATLVSAAIWSIVVGIAAGFSQTVHGLRKTVRNITKLGQYTLEQKLGEGGMGVVYRASHAMLRRPTAVKLLLPDRTDKAALARFEREVRRTAMLTHPNTVTVYDYGRTTDGVFYYAMELLEGLTLEQIVEIDGPQPAERVIHLLDQAAASLAEAHDAGLIHRDVKPSNILVVDRGGIADLVKVLDFGLVKDVRPGASSEDTASVALTQEKAITGTPLYMAPESLTSTRSAPSATGS
jgi:tRNA A-37 threonylcarbamoyl transferase component Bud32